MRRQKKQQQKKVRKEQKNSQKSLAKHPTARTESRNPTSACETVYPAAGFDPPSAFAGKLLINRTRSMNCHSPE